MLVYQKDKDAVLAVLESKDLPFKSARSGNLFVALTNAGYQITNGACDVEYDVGPDIRKRDGRPVEVGRLLVMGHYLYATYPKLSELIDGVRALRVAPETMTADEFHQANQPTESAIASVQEKVNRRP